MRTLARASSCTKLRPTRIFITSVSFSSTGSDTFVRMRLMFSLMQDCVRASQGPPPMSTKRTVLGYHVTYSRECELGRRRFGIVTHNSEHRMQVLSKVTL